MFNGGVKGKRAGDGSGFVSVREQFVQQVLPVPKATSWSVVDGGTFLPIDDTAAGVGSPVVVYGSGFTAGMTVTVGTAVASSVFLDSNRMLFTIPALANGTYNILVASTTGAAILSPGVTISGFPSFTATTYTSTNGALINVQLLASGDAPLSYKMMPGSSLPTGLTLSTTGLISGTLVGVVDNSVFTFVVLVDDAQNQTTQQTITLNAFFTDTQFYNTTLLLNGEITSTTPAFTTDSSSNNSQLIVYGDTKPNSFNPYGDTNYSVFLTKNDYISVPAVTSLTTFTGDFTFECWVYPTDTSVTYWGIWDSRQSGATANAMIFMINPLASAVAGQGRLLYYNGSYLYGTGIVYYNRWTHVAWVRSGSTMTFYVNGVAGGTASVSGTQTGTATSNPIWIGCKDYSVSSAYGNPGYISNLRVVNGTAVYTGNFTPSTSPLAIRQSADTNIAAITTQTVLLACQSSTFVDKSTYNHPLTVSATTTYTSQAIPFNQPTTVTANTGLSVYLNGSSGLGLPSNALFGMGTGDFTIEAWVNIPVFPGTGTTGKIFSSTSANGLGFEISESGQVIVSRTGYAVILTSTSTITLNTWYHVAAVRISGTTTVYINGVAAGSSSDATNYSQSPAYIGLESGPTRYFRGWISNFRLIKGTGYYTAAFTPSTTPLTAITNTVLLTCQGSTFIDYSTTNATLTATGTPVITNSVYPFTMPTTSIANYNTYGSTYFDGTGDYLSVPHSTNQWVGASTNFTIEAWIYKTTIGAETCIVTKGWQGSPAFGEFTFYVSSSNVLTFLASTDGSTWAVNISDTVALTAYAWYHVAVVRNGSTITMYKNGVSVGTPATNSSALYNHTGIIAIGSHLTGSYFAGYISDVRIVIGTPLYTVNNFVLPQIPLTAISNTQLLTCQYNGPVNNAGFVDSSKFNHLITKTGQVSQGSFSPHIPSAWSMFNYSGGSLIFTNTDAPNLNVPTADFSLEAWYNSSAANDTNQRCIASKGDFGTINCAYAIYLYNGYVYGVVGNGSTITQLISTVAHTPYVWHHAALVRTGNVFSLFVDGTRVATNTLAYTLPTSTASFWIGYSTTAVFTGYISNVRLVKGTPPYVATAGSLTVPTSPLTPITGTALLTCQGHRIEDYSPYSQIPTVTNSVDSGVHMVPFSPFGSIKEATPLGYSTRFPGSGNYLYGSNNIFNISATTAVWTFECWVFPSTSGTLFAIGSGSTYGNGMWIDWGVSATDKFRIGQGNGSSNPVNLTTTNTYPAGYWYHVAVSRQGTGIVTMFINGVIDGTVTYNAGTVSTGTTYVVNGTYDNNGLGSNGGNLTISNLRFLVGTALYTTTFTPPTSPLTAITNTQLLICNSTMNVDSSPNAFIPTSNLGPKVIKANPFGYTVQNTASYNSTVHGGSAFFDSNGDYIRAGSSGVTNFKLGADWTIEFWIYPMGTSPLSQPLFYLIGTQGSASVGDFLFSLSSGSVGFAGAGQGGAVLTNAAQLVRAFSWNHIALIRTISDGTLKSYVNGTFAASNTSYMNQVIGTGGLTISSDGSVASTGGYFGYMSDFRITQRVVYTGNFLPPTSPLTDSTNSSTILLNFTNSAIQDKRNMMDYETTISNSLSVVRSTSVKKFGSGSLYFNGSTFLPVYTHGITATGNDLFYLRADFTIEAWVYVTVQSNNGVICFGQATGGGTRFYLQGTSLGMQDYTGGFSFIFSGQTVSTNVWTHIAWVRSGSTVTGYVNGVSAGTGTTSNVIGTGTYTTPVVVGTDWSRTSFFFNGYIDDLRVTRGYARYVANFTPSSSAALTQ